MRLAKMKRLREASRARWANLIACLAAVVLVLFVTISAHAEEVILEFGSEVTLLTDGTVDVVETIRVNAEGYAIKRGIFRDIPTTLVNDDGSKLRSSLDVVEILRDGAPEPFHTEGITDGKRIYLGSEDVFLDRGVHTYRIHYTMTRMARRFADHDELYWNATGTYWDFPILKAWAVVNLPAGAQISDLSGYTGQFGSTEQAVRMTKLGDSRARIEATRALGRYEGLTVSASFQKGLLIEPSDSEQTMDFISDHRDLVFPAIAVFFILFYYFFAWGSVGRDPEKGTIIPLFYPPKGYSPALLHYVSTMGWKNNGWQAFTAAIINLGVKGLVKVDVDDKKTTLTVAGRLGETAEPLPKGETLVFTHINAKSPLTINKTSGPGLSANRGAMMNAIQGENAGLYFRNNAGYVFFGILFSIFSLIGLMVIGALEIEWMFLSIFAGVFLSLIIAALLALWRQTGFARFFRFGILAFFAFNLISLLLNASAVLPAITVGFPAIAVMTIMAVNVIFGMLMRAPTVQGRKVMDQIDGFKMYLETAEKNRLNFTDEPQMTTGRFEAILPYAIALGVEKPWSERFAKELERNTIADNDGSYSPYWYSGSKPFSSASFGKDVAALSSGMSAAMIAAQPVSSSSSGGGGGGSSGGGGGGGGGGGW